MTQFYSRNDVNYSGDVYSIPFDYIDKKEVKVYIDDELWTEWHFLNQHQLTLDEVPAEIGYNNIISVRRETDIEEKVVTYDNNSLLNKENLNKSQDQLLFAVQEIYDNNTQFAIDIRAEVDAKVERVSEAVEKLDMIDASVETSVQKAQEATEQAQIATEKAEETLNTYNEAMAEIDTLRQDSIDEVNQLVADHTNDLNALDTTIKKDAEDIINRVGLNMFDTVIKDHILTYEESKGLALQGTYVYKEAVAGIRHGYPDFYAKCLEEYNEATTTETVNGVTVKVHSNGHKFYNIADKVAIDNYFNTMGSAWFYGVDITNERIFLPRNNYFEQMTGNVAEVGDSIQAGLPNITGYLDINCGWTYTNTSDNSAIYSSYEGPSTLHYSATSDTNTQDRIKIDASRSSAVYGRSSTVQPNAVKKLLYICVGNTVSDTSWVDVVTQVEGGVKDLEDKTNEGLEALANASNALRQTQITNCLLEVPQRIKLELANGVLTLKAGSEVIIPNGFEADGTTPKFDYMTIDNDLNISFDNPYEYPTSMIALAIDGTGYTFKTIEACVSGSASQTYSLYYRTDLNKIFDYEADASTPAFQATLPLGIFNYSGASGITEIKQIFNGMGYIGSTIWVDKGVKGLIPNGRNEDGTLKNNEISISSLELYTAPASYTFSGTILGSNGYLSIWSNSDNNYDEQSNFRYYRTSSTPSLTIDFGSCSITNGVISNFQPKQPFRAVDYNDKPKISGWAMPSGKYIDLTLGASGTIYTAPANGYFFLRKFSSASNQFIGLYQTNNNGVSSEVTNSIANFDSSIFIPVRKGQVVSCYYSFGGETKEFRFVYAEGEV